MQNLINRSIKKEYIHIKTKLKFKIIYFLSYLFTIINVIINIRQIKFIITIINVIITIVNEITKKVNAMISIVNGIVINVIFINNANQGLKN